MPDPIRVFIGTEPKTEIARKVLEFSIERHTEAKVTFTPLIGPAWEYPKDLKVGTGFSLRRWMIAKHCGFQGKAIYLDADQLVLGDIAELMAGLVTGLHPAMPGTANGPIIWCTHQPDKFSATPVPQTSVMVIDCAAAEPAWGFDIARVVQHLRDHPTREAYVKFMHADWLRGYVGTLPVEWNHLNVCTKATRLVHYTKEDQQPWYQPEHPLAHLWQAELIRAIKVERVTAAELQGALDKWNVKEDWRKNNGLHPYYASFLPVEKTRGRPSISAPVKPAVRAAATAATAAAKGARVLWVTSFDPALYEASGRTLLTSFRDKRITGRVLACTEGLGGDEVSADGVLQHDLDRDDFLQGWLKANADVIPAHLGGTHDGICRCPGGPLAVHAKNHRQPCVGYWFNRNASRWFRKVAALRFARKVAARDGDTLLVWVDADCVFKAGVTPRTVESWFWIGNDTRVQLYTHKVARTGYAVFYLKSTRPVLESGVVGFNLNPVTRGDAVIRRLVDRYATGKFRTDPRWEDSYQLQQVLAEFPAEVSLDIAREVGRDHADVVPHSPLAAYLTHDKGRHGRKLGLMT